MRIFFFRIICFSLTFALDLALVAKSEGDLVKNPRIIQEQQCISSQSQRDLPCSVYIYNSNVKKTRLCYGTILDKFNVLTTATCCRYVSPSPVGHYIRDKITGQETEIVLMVGKEPFDRTSPVAKRVDFKTTHPHHKGLSGENDICILHLESEFEFNENISAVTLGTKEDEEFHAHLNGDGIVTGIGNVGSKNNNDGKNTDKNKNQHCQQYPHVKIYTFSQCKSMVNEANKEYDTDILFSEKMICATNYTQKPDLCYTCGGGALLVESYQSRRDRNVEDTDKDNKKNPHPQYVQIGVDSRLVNYCTLDKIPSIFISISPVRSFIEKTMRKYKKY